MPRSIRKKKLRFGERNVLDQSQLDEKTRKRKEVLSTLVDKIKEGNFPTYSKTLQSAYNRLIESTLDDITKNYEAYKKLITPSIKLSFTMRKVNKLDQLMNEYKEGIKLIDDKKIRINETPNVTTYEYTKDEKISKKRAVFSDYSENKARLEQTYEKLLVFKELVKDTECSGSVKDIEELNDYKKQKILSDISKCGEISQIDLEKIKEQLPDFRKNTYPELFEYTKNLIPPGSEFGTRRRRSNRRRSRSRRSVRRRRSLRFGDGIMNEGLFSTIGDIKKLVSEGKLPDNKEYKSLINYVEERQKTLEEKDFSTFTDVLYDLMMLYVNSINEGQKRLINGIINDILPALKCVGFLP
jgi:hypothetical protein